ncbi:MAG: FHA domain-containing protein [Pseudomonadota bacterium]
METEAILKEFNEHLDRYATHRGYIDRARAHAHKFSAAVVEKVILDHEIKSTEVAEEVLPLVPHLQEVMANLEAQRAAIINNKASAEEQMEELNLRQAIGELSDEEFEATSAAFKGELEQAGERVAAIDAEHATLSTALERWVELAASAEQDPGLAPAERGAPAEPERIASAQPEPEIPIVDDEPVIRDQDGIHISTSGTVEDVSAAFGIDDEPAEVVALEAEESLGDEVSAEIDLGFGDEANDVQVIHEDDAGLDLDPEIDLGFGIAPAEVELAIESDGEVEVEGAEIDIAPDDKAVDNRRALLLYQEGTPEEQIYPFTGEVITVGRGRDNDIQIKNDSKVSRYHCKVFRRGTNFYIEDNKSSNGTLVNGELITERRLFGGEEVIIGETFFRFRVME